MAMGQYLCQLCYTIVAYGDRHPCFFYKDEETVYIVPQPDETEEVDINHDKATGKHAENSDANYWYMLETAQTSRNTSLASTSGMNSVFSTGKCCSPYSEMSFEVSRNFLCRSLLPEASFKSQSRKRKVDFNEKQTPESKQDAGVVNEPSGFHPHKRGSRGETHYACDLCTYRCKMKFNFEAHYRTHTGEKPFTCRTCGRNFIQKQQLNRHMRTHTREKQYSCDICGRRFTDQSTCKRHVLTHDGKNTQKGTLDSHLRTHTGEKPYSCDICGRTFSQDYICRRHVATHDSENRYKCGECGETFGTNEHRNRHVNDKHR